MSFALAKLFLHLIANSRYGLHADELYYIALSKHLQWGYFDNGPFITWMVKISKVCFGPTTFGWRVWPSIMSAAMVALTGKMAVRLGGGYFALTISCTAMLCSPAFTATAYLLQPVIFDQFFWTLLAFAIVSYWNSRHEGYLYLAAVAIGLGVLNKLSIGIYLITFVLPFTIFVVKDRKVVQKWALPALVFVVLIFPYACWQLYNGLPAAAYINLVVHRQVYDNLLQYIFQLLFFHGAAVAVWLAGLVFVFIKKGGMMEFRMAGLCFVISTIALFFLNGKLYYLLGSFPFWFALGGVCWEKLLINSAIFAKTLLIGIQAFIAVIALPVVMPILPYKQLQNYIGLMRAYTPIVDPLRWDDGRIHALPQYFSDMIGWEEFAEKVQKARHALQSGNRLPPVYAESYAAVGAILYYTDCAASEILTDNNSFTQWSSLEVPDNFVYVSDEDPKMVATFARNVIKVEGVNQAYASSSSLNIYLISYPRPAFVKRYFQRIRQFNKNSK